MIDTHAHLNFSDFDTDREETFARATAEGVKQIINVGTNLDTARRAVMLAEKYPSFYAAIGLHPTEIDKEKFDYAEYLTLSKKTKVVAIGEVGLDYHYFREGDDIAREKEKQKKIFQEFIRLANEADKPLIIHCRDAYDDLEKILKNSLVKKKGVIHSFVGGYKTARRFIEMGYKIGLNGIITYGASYDRLIKELNLKDIMIETDCPYLTPLPLNKTTRNEPAYIRHTFERIAKVKAISVNELDVCTSNNASALFGI